MKQFLSLILAMTMLFALTACGKSAAPAATPTPEPTAEPAIVEDADEDPDEEPAAPEALTVDYAGFVAAELDTLVTVETYVQAKQSWWDNKATFYTQDEDGAYFIYNMACTEEEFNKLVPGTRIRVTGYKAEWAGEVELTDATYEIVEADPFIAEPVDVTALLGTDELIEYQNRLVAFKGVTVEEYADGAAFAYKNPTDKTDDLYFKVSADGKSYEFCVEYYLCNEETEVYKAVEGLNVGDVVDLEGFLYWYEGPNPHITGLSVVTPAK